MAEPEAANSGTCEPEASVLPLAHGVGTSFLSVAVIEHSDEKQCRGRKRVFFWLQLSAHQGTSGQELKQGLEAEAMEGLFAGSLLVS